VPASATDPCTDLTDVLWTGSGSDDYFSTQLNWFPIGVPHFQNVAVFEDPDQLCIFNIDPEPEVAWDVGALRIESSAAPGQNQEPSILRMLEAETGEYPGKVNFLCGVSSEAGINGFTIHLAGQDMVSLGTAIQGLDPILDVDIADVQVLLAGEDVGGKFSMTGTFGPGRVDASNARIGIGFTSHPQLSYPLAR
jgi:hypothetical protein